MNVPQVPLSICTWNFSESFDCQQKKQSQKVKFGNNTTTWPDKRDYDKRTLKELWSGNVLKTGLETSSFLVLISTYFLLIDLHFVSWKDASLYKLAVLEVSSSENCFQSQDFEKEKDFSSNLCLFKTELKLRGRWENSKLRRNLSLNLGEEGGQIWRSIGCWVAH